VASLFLRGREGTFQQGEYHGDGAMRVKAKKWIKIGIFIFIAVAVLVSVSDVRKMIHLSAKLDPYFLGLSFSAAFVSYLLIAISLKKILELMDIRLPFLEIFTISWISTSINYVLSTGGVGGFTARVYLLKKKGISYSDTIVVSIIHSFIMNVILMLFVLNWFCNLDGFVKSPSAAFRCIPCPVKLKAAISRRYGI